MGCCPWAWAGESLLDGTRPAAPDPGPSGGIPLLIGGMTDATIRRVVEFGAGWTAGGAPLEATAAFIERVGRAWRDAGRDGTPRIVALSYFSLGGTEQESRASLLDYYQPMGPEMAEMIAGSALHSPEAIEEAVKAFAGIGVDEVILDPTVSDPGQVDLLEDVVL